MPFKVIKITWPLHNFSKIGGTEIPGKESLMPNSLPEIKEEMFLQGREFVLDEI